MNSAATSAIPWATSLSTHPRRVWSSLRPEPGASSLRRAPIRRRGSRKKTNYLNDERRIWEPVSGARIELGVAPRENTGVPAAARFGGRARRYSDFDARYKIDANDGEMSRHVKWMRVAYGNCGPTELAESAN
jgi:hypothetical protein